MKSIHRFALCAPICIAASFITTGSASAALISVGVQTLNVSSTTQLLNTGTQVFAWDTAGVAAAPTVNSITFSNADPVSPVSVSYAGWNVGSGFTSTAHADAGMNNLLQDMFFSNGGFGIQSTVTLNGLTIGQEYRLQFLHYQEGTTPGAREFEVFFGTTSGTSTGGFAPAGLGNFHISTFIFTAADSDSNVGNGAEQLFTFRTANNSGDDRNLLNAATLYAVPEPSAALLGGLGMIALLRRRRN